MTSSNCVKRGSYYIKTIVLDLPFIYPISQKARTRSLTKVKMPFTESIVEVQFKKGEQHVTLQPVACCMLQHVVYLIHINFAQRQYVLFWCVSFRAGKFLSKFRKKCINPVLIVAHSLFTHNFCTKFRAWIDLVAQMSEN